VQFIRASLESWKLDVGIYPKVSEYPADCGTGIDLKRGTTVYVRDLPCDPSKNNGYWNSGEYWYCTDNFEYVIVACLENNADTDPNVLTPANAPSVTTMPVGCSLPIACSSNTYYVLRNL